MRGPVATDGPAAAGTYVFAYGSNLDTERMQGRVPTARIVGVSQLDGFELRFHKRGWDDGTGKANAFPAAASVVHGVVYAIDDRQLPDLDVYETGYDRRLVTFVLERAESSTVEAWVYLARSEVIDDSLVPTRHYLNHVLTGARAHGLPDDLVAHLESLPTLKES